jgi:hypothetical protein
MLFSQRHGLKPIQKIIQIDSMDDELRNGLWNCLMVIYFNNFSGGGDPMSPMALRGSNLHSLFNGYWHSFLKRPLDNLHDVFPRAYDEVRELFFRFSWNEVYDFIEFTAENGPEELAEQFRGLCNSILERENSGYRFVGRQITQITDPAEISSIQAALTAATPVMPVKAHLETALSLLSDRKKPDFRNSIKESISAIEALARKISGNPKATLGDALKVLEAKNCLHGALKNSLSALYGYTSGAQGIRHAMLDEPTLTYGDAKFMFVSCTAFVNLILIKAAELKIPIK